MIRRWLPLLVFVALAGLLLVGIERNRGRNPQDIPSPLIGKPAPDFALPDFRDPSRTIRQQDLRGSPYLLNVFGSWCPECRVEHPMITALAQRGVLKVVGYNYKDDEADAREWLEQFGDPYHLIVVDRDGRGAFDWGIYGAPESFLVDAQGIVRFKHIGALTPQIIEREILPRLKESQP